MRFIKKHISLIIIIILLGIITSLIVILINTSENKSTLNSEVDLHKTLLIEKDTIINEQINKLDMLEKSKEQLNTDYENITKQYKVLDEKYKELVKDYETQTSEINDSSFIQNYRGLKYPVASGIRHIIGDNPLRIYPSSQAPYVYGDYKPYIVEVINEVYNFSSGENWCHVIDADGVSGYINRNDIATIDEIEEDVITSSESLGGFRSGERIESIIGELDRDYYLIYENSRIYVFPDSQKVTVENPIDRPFLDIKTLDVFVNDLNDSTFLRTNSPEFQLESGYKVGDNAIEVLNHYNSIYEIDDDKEGLAWYYGYDYSYKIGDGLLMFRIESEQLESNSIISSIVIR